MEAEAVIDQLKRPVVVGDRTALLADLYRREYAPMVRLAHLITGSNEAAEDLVQDSFVRLCRSWDRADEPGAYLRQIVVNRCHSWHRRRRPTTSPPPPRARIGGPGCGTSSSL